MHLRVVTLARVFFSAACAHGPWNVREEVRTVHALRPPLFPLQKEPGSITVYAPANPELQKHLGAKPDAAELEFVVDGRVDSTSSRELTLTDHYISDPVVEGNRVYVKHRTEDFTVSATTAWVSGRVTVRSRGATLQTKELRMWGVGGGPDEAARKAYANFAQEAVAYAKGWITVPIDEQVPVALTDDPPSVALKETLFAALSNPGPDSAASLRDAEKKLLATLREEALQKEDAKVRTVEVEHAVAAHHNLAVLYLVVAGDERLARIHAALAMSMSEFGSFSETFFPLYRKLVARSLPVPLAPREADASAQANAAEGRRKLAEGAASLRLGSSLSAIPVLRQAGALAVLAGDDALLLEVFDALVPALQDRLADDQWTRGAAVLARASLERATGRADAADEDERQGTALCSGTREPVKHGD